MFIILVSNFHARITSTVILKVAEHSFSSAQRLVSGAMHCGANFSCKTKMATTLIFPCSSRVISLARVFALLQIGRTCCVVFLIAVRFQRKHQSQKIFFKISSIRQSEWTRLVIASARTVSAKIISALAGFGLSWPVVW